MDFLEGLQKSMETGKKVKPAEFAGTWGILPKMNSAFIFYKNENQIIPYAVEDFFRTDWELMDE